MEDCLELAMLKVFHLLMQIFPFEASSQEFVPVVFIEDPLVSEQQTMSRQMNSFNTMCHDQTKKH